MLTYQGSYSFDNNCYVYIFKNLSFSSLICQLTSFLSFHFTLLVLPECLSSLCASVASVFSIDGVLRDASGVSKILLVVLFARIESSRMLFPVCEVHFVTLFSRRRSFVVLCTSSRAFLTCVLSTRRNLFHAFPAHRLVLIASRLLIILPTTRARS